MGLRTIAFIGTLIFGLFSTPLPSEPQESAKIPRIGFLTARANPTSIGVVKEGLRELGYVEGRDFVIVHRYVRGAAKPPSELTAELIDLEVDVLVVPDTTGAVAAMKATTTIPIIMVSGADLVKRGFVASLAQPGGNVTGFSTRSPELAGKQLELFTAAFPAVSRVAVLWAGWRKSSARNFRQLQITAPKLGMEVHSIELRTKTNPDFAELFKAVMKPAMDAFFVVSSAPLSNHRARILELVADTRLAAMFNHSRWVKAGGLMSYAPRRRDLYLLVASYVDKILKGAKPADLPVQRAKRIYLDINLETAKKLGLSFPPSILYRADKVIR